MQERLLQFIWQHKYFNFHNLHSLNGEAIQIIDVGFLNRDQGPDFLEGKIKIDKTTFVGNIELHILSSDWYLHKHHLDKAYQNIILHVVWQNDVEIKEASFPTIELQPLVANSMLDWYRELMIKNCFVPCENELPALSSIQWTAWKDRLMVERLERKSAEVSWLLQKSNNDWSEVLWQMIAKAFGAKVNGFYFLELAKSLPQKLLAKHKNQQNAIEALLLGQCGLLEESFSDAYTIMLQKEYRFLKQKYRLTPLVSKPAFLRMRPQNFPTIRLSQLASLIYQSNFLFSKIMEIEDFDIVQKLFCVDATDYWGTHYTFQDEEHAFKRKQLGQSTIDLIIINAVVPVLFLYGNAHGLQNYSDKALLWLSKIKAEKNTVIKAWQYHSITCSSALDSQALIELKNMYCDKKLCLSCAIGSHIMRKKADTI